MKRIGIFTMIFSLFIIGTVAYAQSAKMATVSGYVVDAATNEPMIGAVIIKDTISGAGATTDAKGYFVLKNMPMNKETVILVQYSSYTTRPVSIKPTKEIFVLPQPITLSTAMNMAEVTVYGTSPIAEIKGDTTQFNAGAYKTNPDASASDLIAKMPGFKQNADGTVSKDGESVTKVLVDGKNYFRDDVATALNSLPANVIESIQFIDDKSDESKFTGFDDGDRVKTINIVTKTKQKSAIMGDYYAGYGFGKNTQTIGADGGTPMASSGINNHYMGAANTNIFTQKDIITIGFGANNINSSPLSQRGFYGGRGGSGLSDQIGLRFNYDRQIKGGSISATYTYSYRDQLIEKLTKETNNSILSNTISYDTTKNISQNHRLNLYYEQQLNSNNKLISRPSFSFSTTESNRFSLEENVYPPEKYMNTTARTKSATESTTYNINPNIMWFHNFSQKQFLTMGARASLSNDNQTRIIESDIRRFLEDGEKDSISNQKIRDLSSGNDLNFNVGFTQRMGKYSGLSLRYNIGYNWSDSEKKTYMWDNAMGGYRDINDDLSNTFARDYLTNSINLGYSYNENGIHVFNMGAGYKNSSLQNNMTYPTVLPTEKYSFNAPEVMVGYRYKISNSKNFNLMFMSNSRLPSLTQLQNVLDVSNPLSVSMGNPDLNQSYNSMLSLSYRASNVEKSTSFSTYARANQTQNYFARNRVSLERDTLINGITIQKGARFTKTVNLDGFWSARVGATYAFPFKAIKSNVNMDLGYNFARTPEIENNQRFNSYENGVSYDIKLVSNITPELDFTVSSDTEYTRISSTRANGSSNSTSVTNNIVESVRVRMDWIFWKGFFVNIDYNYRYNYLSNVNTDTYNPNQNILNAAIGKKFMNNNLEVRVSAFDLLGQYRSISSSVNGSVASNTFANSLTRYFAFSIKYKFNTMQGSSGLRKNANTNNRFGGHGGGGGGGMIRF